jgi:hypothetical protein
MEQKKKIFQLSYEELRNCLCTNFIKVGISMAADDVRLRITIQDVFKHHYKLWVENIDDMFSDFAAGTLPGTEKLQPTVSSFFIRHLRHAFFQKFVAMKKANEPKREELTDKQYAYYNLIQYCLFYNKFPANINWQLILSYLVDKGHFKLYEGFEQEHFAIKEKTARVHVKSWVKDNMPKIKAQVNKLPMAA